MSVKMVTPGSYAVKAVSETKKIYDGILPLMDENLVQLPDTSKSSKMTDTTMQPMELESKKPTSTAKGVLHLGGEDAVDKREDLKAEVEPLAMLMKEVSGDNSWKRRSLSGTGTQSSRFGAPRVLRLRVPVWSSMQRRCSISSRPRKS